MVDLISKILEVFVNNNLFKEGVELIGSWCFKLYQKHLGVENFPLRTPDIDFLIPTPFHGKEHANFVEQLEALGFEVDFKSDGSLYLWNVELKIEFITAEKGKGTDKAVKVNKLGINAIPLRHVGLLLDKPIMVMDDGKKIRVPAPSRFCLHKLIIASRRRKLDKSLKDLQQAIYTSVIVDKKEIQELFLTLPKKWRQAVLRMLDKSKAEFPLMGQEIGKLSLTLQNVGKLKM
ncbi:MAG: GSU2403 family nucleotidyltransferase fold protein [Candidatus Omnitrophota bacterium]